VATKTPASTPAVPAAKRPAWAFALPRRRPQFPWVRLTFLLPGVLYVILFYGYPLYYSLRISFEHYNLKAIVSGVAFFNGLANYLNVFQDPIFRVAGFNTLIFTFGSIIPQFLIGLVLALFFTRHFPLSRFLRSLILLPWLIPLVVSGTIWRWLFDQTNGIIDQIFAALHLLPAHFGWLTAPHAALAAVIATNVWVGVPFNMVILYSGLQSISQDYYEAAAIDGANRWQTFFHITVPLLEPVIAIVLMLGLIYTLKVFDIIYVMTGGGPANATQIFATWAYNLAFAQQLFGQGAAMGNTIMFISLGFALIYLWFARRTV
jgi:multiple sugar transport system permease protein